MSKQKIRDVPFSERMHSLLSRFNSKSEFAKAVGATVSSLERWLSGESDPSRSNLVSLAKAAGVSLEWLATGEGAETIDSDNINKFSGSDLSYDVLGRQVDTSRFAFIPFYQDVHASAGFGYPVNDEDYDYCLAFRKDYINLNITTDIKDLSVITVRGNSMEGLLSHNDLILVNHAKKDPADGLYVLRIGNDLFVKLIQRFPNKLLVKSTNPNYEPFEISLDDDNPDLNIIGKVEWLGRTIV